MVRVMRAPSCCQGLGGLDEVVRGVGAGGDEGRVGGRVARHVGRAAAVELGAQHRDDLAAEDLELLEHDLGRQSGVVDEEQLALVVTGVVGEAQRALDDLLGGADGQRRGLW